MLLVYYSGYFPHFLFKQMMYMAKKLYLSLCYYELICTTLYRYTP